MNGENIDISITPMPAIKFEDHVTKFIVCFNGTKCAEHISAEYLESNQTFLFFVDTSKYEEIVEMEDYKSISVKWPNSSRVIEKAFWLGNMIEPLEAVKQILSIWIKGKFTIEIIGEQ